MSGARHLAVAGLDKRQGIGFRREDGRPRQAGAEPQHVRLDPETKRLVREGVPLELNEFDVYAVTEAIRLRDAHGGEVVTMTMGPPQAEDALRMTLAMGADRAIHLNDKVFAVADTIGTSRTLALAVAKEAPTSSSAAARRWTRDLAGAGRGRSASAGPSSPSWTGCRRRRAACAAAGRRTRASTHTSSSCPRSSRSPRGSTRASGPAKRDVEATDTAGRLETWTAGDLVGDVEEDDPRFGQTGSPTRVLAVKDVTPSAGGERAAGPEAAARILELLAEAGDPLASPWDKFRAPRRGARQELRLLDRRRAGGRRAATVSLELLGKGRELAGKLGGANFAVLLGDPGGEHDLARWGAERIVVLPVPGEYYPMSTRGP